MNIIRKLLNRERRPVAGEDIFAGQSMYYSSGKFYPVAEPEPQINPDDIAGEDLKSGVLLYYGEDGLLYGLRAGMVVPTVGILMGDTLKGQPVKMVRYGAITFVERGE